MPSMNQLKEAGVDSPRRDCMVLLEDLLKKDRSWVTAHGEHKLNVSQVKILNAQIKRRTNREPLAYIRGKAWFYGRFFEVNPSVLIPRPESENFIELLKEIKPTKIIDIGTGSGCLAITASLELPSAIVIGSDVSIKALKVAQKNARMYKVNIKFVQGSFLDPFLSSGDLAGTTILANLPYVPNGLITSPEVTTEPAQALFSGNDGLEHYRKFWHQIRQLSQKPLYILTESLENQHKSLNQLAADSGYKLQKTDVLIQQFKQL